jgi:hypothetical protein
MGSLGTFPSQWPDGCPPGDAFAPDAEYFRIVRLDPPGPEDFLSYAELGKRPKGSDPCRLRGLSVFDSWEAANVARLNFPSLGHLIARGTLTSTHGQIKQTGRHHHFTWWPYEGIDRAAPFETVPEQ